MTTIYDVPADSLISEVAKGTKPNKKINPLSGQPLLKQVSIRKEDPTTLTGGMLDVHPY